LIRIELTAGGGGNSTGRKSKISERNQRLNKQRQKAFQKQSEKPYL